MKKGNREAILAKAMEDGYIIQEEVVDAPKRNKNRTLREVLEHKLTSKGMTKKAVLSYLADRAKAAGGAREKARVEGLVKHFTDFRVKETKAEAEASS
jgi:hypothetical protein